MGQTTEDMFTTLKERLQRELDSGSLTAEDAKLTTTAIEKLDAAFLLVTDRSF